jgi:hypothetical protein
LSVRRSLFILVCLKVTVTVITLPQYLSAPLVTHFYPLIGLPEVFQEAEKWELDKAWTRFFYEANIPFVVSKNKTFKEAVKRIAEFCGEIYVPPFYHDLQQKFLVQAKEELQAHL